MVFIKELLPNPAGKDAAGEWIALLNDGEEAVNLRGWTLADASGKKFVFGSQTLGSHQELKAPHSLTRIALNNDGDTVTLRDATGAQVDELSYGQVAEEEIVTSEKIVPGAEAQALTASPLQAAAFKGREITANEISPLFIALGAALAFGIAAGWLTKKLIEA